MESCPVAVIMERTPLRSGWGGERWEAIGVLPRDATGFDATRRSLFADHERQQFRVGGLAIELFRDDAESYFLNLSSPVPKVFVMWRFEDNFARPVLATVSYAEAARLIDSGEQVDGVAMSREIADWVGHFVNTHYRPEPRRPRRRQESSGEAAGSGGPP